MKQLVVLVFALFLAGCSRSSLTGTYTSVGDENKFRMVLEVRDGGQAAFSTHANLGNKELDRAVEATMTLRSGRWTRDNAFLTVTGTQGDGKPVTYRFAIQKNGDLIWDKNGARLVPAK